VRGLPPVVETRSLAACREALAESPQSLIALETSVAHCDAVQSFMTSMARIHSDVPLIGLLTPEAAEAEVLLREAGAVDVIHSVLEIPRLARLAARYARQTPYVEPSLDRFVADMLPWPGLATREWLASVS
jgi:hypothetical protein